MWIFRPSKLRQKKYVETTWIFRPAKLHRKKYVETTWIFRPSKSHRKGTWKWRGNSSKFGLRRIDVISTSNGRGFDVVCALGICFTNFKNWHRRTNDRKTNISGIVGDQNNCNSSIRIDFTGLLRIKLFLQNKITILYFLLAA